MEADYCIIALDQNDFDIWRVSTSKQEIPQRTAAVTLQEPHSWRGGGGGGGEEEEKERDKRGRTRAEQKEQEAGGRQR